MRDMAMSAAFGADPCLAAFMVAYRLANLLRRIFAEGALQSAFIPHFESLRVKSEARAACLVRDLSFGMAQFLLPLITLLALAIYLVSLFALPSQETRQIADLTILLLPCLLFISLSGLHSGLQQCFSSYFLPGLSPAVCNLIWVAGVLALRHKTPVQAMPLLCLVVVCAFAGQWLCVAWPTGKYLKAHPAKIQGLASPDLRALLKPLFLGFVGVSSSQISSALDPLFARVADAAGPAYLWYAIRLQQVPMALFGVAFAGALLPPLSRAAKIGDEQRFSHLLNYGFNQAIAIMIPATFALFAMGHSSLSLLFGRGHFTALDLENTTICLFSYSLGVLPAAAVLLLASALYALGSYRLTSRASVFCTLFSLACNFFLLFVCKMSSASVALSTSLSGCLNCALLIRPLKERLDWRHVRRQALKITLCSLLAAAASIAAGYALSDHFLLSWIRGETRLPVKHTFIHQLTLLAIEAIAFFLSLSSSSYLLRLESPFHLRFFWRKPSAPR